MIDELGENYVSDSVKSRIPKCSFQTKKTGKDGLVLQVHHTLPDATGKARSYRFTSSSFDITGERLAVSDSLGNAFIIDLLSHKFWMLPKLPACNFLLFSRFIPKKHEVLVGSVSGPLNFVDTDSGEVTGELTGHKSSPLSASFAEDEPFCLTVSSSSAIIWDLRSSAMMHQLTLRSSIAIKQVKFMPVSNNILGLFEDNSVHIWKLENLECAKQILPEEWGAPNIKTIAFTRNGRGMVMAGQSASLAVFLLDNWTLQKLIALPEYCKGVKHVEFIPQLFDGGANKVLGILTSSCSALFVDTETSVLLKTLGQSEGCVNRLEASLNGKYIVLGLQTGEVNIHCSCDLVLNSLSEALVYETQACQPSRLTRKQHSTHTINHLPEQLRKEPPQRLKTQLTLWLLERGSFYSVKIYSCIELDRLRPILKEFGEYPEVHRSLIWKMILKLPENQGAYVGLINKGIHPAFSTLEKIFPLSDRSLLNSVKRLLSCLVYWSPVFIQVKYLPIFVLPFVKLIRHDQFACFEVVATIINSWWQGWCECVPFPPVRLLDSVNAQLGSHDQQLASHLAQCHVRPDLYIWSLLETAFYEVLGWKEWQQLWDHVLSNHPAFLLFTVLAFNITCRSSLLCLTRIDDFQQFFHTEVVINMKQLITKSYQLWTNTPSEIHPKHSLTPFQPFTKGSMYQMFSDYPKTLLDNQLEKLSSLYEEKSTLQSQQAQVNRLSLGIHADKKIKEASWLQENRLREMEKAYKHSLEREEERLDNERRNVSVARRDLREKETFVRSQALDKTLQDKADRYAQLEKLLQQLESKKGSSGLQSSSGLSSLCQSSNPSSLRLQHASVVHHLSKLKKLCRQSNTNSPQLKLCINKFEDLLARIETSLERELTWKHLRPSQTEQIVELEDETRALEDEAQQLLRKLTTVTGREAGQHEHCYRYNCSQIGARDSP